MYNSRPRRANYDGYTRDFVLPENYAGNAFRESTVEESGNKGDDAMQKSEDALETFEELGESIDENEAQECIAKPQEKGECKRLTHPHPFSFKVGRIFGGGIGVEELLIIGLILLIAQSENNEDIIVLLALLLFIG